MTEEIACFEGPGSKFVTLTFAQSLDGSIAAGIGGKPLALSAPKSFKMTHRLRARHQAIAVGIGTIKADNPSLTTRLVEGPSPQPVIFDSKLECPLSCKLLNDTRCHKPILICAPKLVSEDADEMEKFLARKETLEQAGATVITCDPLGRHLDLHKALQLVTERFSTVMVEGGASIISSILGGRAQDLVTSVVLTVAPKFVGGLNCIQWPKRAGDESETAQESTSSECSLDLKMRQLFNMDGDIVVCYGV